MSPRSNRKTSTWSVVNFKKHSTSVSCKLEPAIWLRDIGQRIPCFDRCQLIITWMSNIKGVHSKPRLHVSVNPLFGVWLPCCATPSSSSSSSSSSSPSPQAIPLATITMRKSTHGFPFISHMSMGLRLAFGPPELRYNKTLNVLLVFSVTQFKIDQNKK